MSIDGQGTLQRRNIAEIFNRLSRVHKRYRQTTDRRMDDDIANVKACTAMCTQIADICCTFVVIRFKGANYESKFNISSF